MQQCVVGPRAPPDTTVVHFAQRPAPLRIQVSETEYAQLPSPDIRQPVFGSLAFEQCTRRGCIFIPARQGLPHGWSGDHFLGGGKCDSPDRHDLSLLPLIAPACSRGSIAQAIAAGGRGIGDVSQSLFLPVFHELHKRVCMVVRSVFC
jgi:hypothetical protein